MRGQPGRHPARQDAHVSRWSVDTAPAMGVVARRRHRLTAQQPRTLSGGASAPLATTKPFDGSGYSAVRPEGYKRSPGSWTATPFAAHLYERLPIVLNRLDGPGAHRYPAFLASGSSQADSGLQELEIRPVEANEFSRSQPWCAQGFPNRPIPFGGSASLLIQGAVHPPRPPGGHWIPASAVLVSSHRWPDSR